MVILYGKMAMRDDIEFNIQFCKVIETFPSIYDYSRSDYCNRSAQVWQQIATKFGVQAEDCKERWKNLRGRYTKYKNQLKLPSRSGAKKRKQYYLASHLRFLDPFLKSRPSRSNIFTEEKPTQDEAVDSEDENRNENIDEGLSETQATPPTSSPVPMPPLPQDRKKDSNFRKKRKSLDANLDDVNSSAFMYSEAKQQILEQQCNSTSQPDHDMAFLQSVWPDMKAMNDWQKMRFKRGVLRLAEEILYPETLYSAESSMSAQLEEYSISALSTDSSNVHHQCQQVKVEINQLTSPK